MYSLLPSQLPTKMLRCYANPPYIHARCGPRLAKNIAVDLLISCKSLDLNRSIFTVNNKL